MRLQVKPIHLVHPAIVALMAFIAYGPAERLRKSVVDFRGKPSLFGFLFITFWLLWITMIFVHLVHRSQERGWPKARKTYESIIANQQSGHIPERSRPRVLLALSTGHAFLPAGRFEPLLTSNELAIDRRSSTSLAARSGSQWWCLMNQAMADSFCFPINRITSVSSPSTV